MYCWLPMTFAAAITAGTEPDLPLEMVFIPAGEFTMGTSAEEAARLAAEQGVHPSMFAGEVPQRKVQVDSFLIDRYPVTNDQYRRFVEATQTQPPGNWPNGEMPPELADHPVTNLGHRQAAAYAKWVGKRLPTEAEWEKAARGTDGRVYPWGNEWRDDACRRDDPSCPVTLGNTTPVGAFPAGASPYGVFDLCGNVAEMTATDSQPPNEQLDWHWYVVKGAGAAQRMTYSFRCANRCFSAHDSRRHSWLGFRCALDAKEAPPNLAPPRPTPALPPLPTAAGPDETALGQPIEFVTAKEGRGITLRVPWFPVGSFGINLPEQAGAAGQPLGWGIKFEPILWERSEDGSICRYICRFPEHGAMTVTLKRGADYVDFTIALRNDTAETWTQCYSNTCFNPHASPYFEDPERLRMMVVTDDGPTPARTMPQSGGGEPMHGGWTIATADQTASPQTGLARLPLILLESRDGQWTIAEAYPAALNLASNMHYSCLHTRPVWPDIPPGEEREVTGRLYFIHGDAQALVDRWRHDFGATP